MLHHPLHDHPPRPRRGFSLPRTGLRLLAPPRTAGMGGKRTLHNESGGSTTPTHWSHGHKANATRAGAPQLRRIGHMVAKQTQGKRGLPHPDALATWSQGKHNESGDSPTPLHWPRGRKAGARKAGTPPPRCIGHMVTRQTQRERGLPHPNALVTQLQSIRNESGDSHGGTPRFVGFILLAAFYCISFSTASMMDSTLGSM